jgi:hypothetical protein
MAVIVVTGLPDWQAVFQNHVAGGKSADLAQASAANVTRAFPAPVES